MTKENLLVTLADKNYIDQAKQLFSSVYWNAGWKGDYMLLAHEIPEKDLKWFRNKGILIKKCKPLYDKKIGRDKHPGVVITKIYLFTPEFKKWKHVIYLDADIIVRASLDKLTKVKGFGAAPDIYLNELDKQFVKKESNIFNQIKTRYDLKKPSFNAGVIVFSTNIFKTDIYKKLIFLFKRDISLLAYGEQTLLNLYFYGCWIKLSLIYNLCLESFEIYHRYIPKEGIILHFSGVKKFYKPWHPQNPFYKEWKYNLDRAELIDLNNIPKGKKWSKIKILKYLTIIKLKYLLLSLLIKIDYFIGRVGISLKKYTPKVYVILNGIKSLFEKIAQKSKDNNNL